MFDLGINIERFNPKVIYAFRKKFGEGSIKTHTHDFPSMVYVFSGSGTYTISSNKYNVARGNLIVINPGVPHGKTLSDSEEINEFHIAFNNVQFEGLEKDFIIPGDMSPVISLKKHDREFFQCCGDILVEQKKNELTLLGS